MNRVAYVLSIIYAIFISIFAFDEIGHSIIGFLIHLIPTFLVIVVTLISRKYPHIGAFLFGLLFVATVLFFRTYQDAVVFALISLPLAIVSALLIGSLLSKSSQRRS